MTHFRIIGPALALVASTLACATPNKYTPTDAGDAGGEESPDSATTAKLDAGAPASDAPLTPDVPSMDGPAATDTAAPPSDGPCGTPTDPHNCGTCGHDCTRLANVVASAVSCQAGKCVVPASACTGGYAHCSANVEDGCEASLARQETCGGCNTKCGPAELCAVAGGSYQCASSCSGATPDKCTGTCTNLQTDSHNCGSCGHDCAQLANVKPGAPVSCQGGHCVIAATSCNTGYGHCGSSPPDNGCETNISVPQTCGCSSCAAGQVCMPNGGSYQCGCGGAAPTRCGSKCVSLPTDADNCGQCGHSCLGGVCTGGKCEAVQIYKGKDFLPESFTTDGSYIYFKRSKPGDVIVLARMTKDGGQVTDLTSVDEGFERVALVNGILYWARGDVIKGCAAPSCSSPVVIPNQPEAHKATANAEHTKLFWGRTGSSPSTIEIMTDASNPVVHGTLPMVTINDMSARGNNAYIYDGDKSYRASGSGAAVLIGPGGFRLMANSSSLFFLDTVMAGSDALAALKKYSLAAIGTAQTASEVGRATGALGGFYGVAVDERDAYWMVGGDMDVSMRLLYCPITGCSGTPQELAHTLVSFPDGTMVMDSEAVYWGTQDGVFKIAR
jgi:hypothetical protein